MQHWPWVRELVFWGSLALNAVLFVLFFFKSAINEIAREWWIDRRRHKEEERDRLYELRRHLRWYPANHLSLVIQSVLIGQVRSEPELREIRTAVDGVQRVLRETLDFVVANEPRFPPTIQEGLRELRGVSRIDDVLRDSSLMLAGHERVAAVCEQLVARIDAILRDNGS